MNNIVLLGDSIFDNAYYVRGGPDVFTHLRNLLPETWIPTLLAIDGATSRDVRDQLRRLPPDATHIVVSMGGNDALMAGHLLYVEVTSVSEALLVLSPALEDFERGYRQTLRDILNTKLPITVCTIYNANIEQVSQSRVFKIAVALFNDVILRVAREEHLPVIELRSVCTEPSDYANDIEPSIQGGHKIASAIAAAVLPKAV